MSDVFGQLDGGYDDNGSRCKFHCVAYILAAYPCHYFIIMEREVQLPNVALPPVFRIPAFVKGTLRVVMSGVSCRTTIGSETSRAESAADSLEFWDIVILLNEYMSQI